jgi:hypothetical protein
VTGHDDEDRCLVFGTRSTGFQVIKGFIETEEQQEIEHWILKHFGKKRRQGWVFSHTHLTMCFLGGTSVEQAWTRTSTGRRMDQLLLD